MSNASDNSGFFSKIMSLLFGGSGPVQDTHDAPGSENFADNQAQFNDADSGMKLVVSHDQAWGDNISPHSSDMPNTISEGPSFYDKDFSSFTMVDTDLPHTSVVNQNASSFVDSLLPIQDSDASNLNTGQDDVITTQVASLHDLGMDLGSILNASAITTFNTEYHNLEVANDAGHNVLLDASDVLDMGNNLVITGHELDSINFQDDGWTRIDYNEPHPLGIEPMEGFITYIHDTGAIVQIDSIIHTNHDPHGHGHM